MFGATAYGEVAYGELPSVHGVATISAQSASASGAGTNLLVLLRNIAASGRKPAPGGKGGIQ